MWPGIIAWMARTEMPVRSFLRVVLYILAVYDAVASPSRNASLECICEGVGNRDISELMTTQTSGVPGLVRSRRKAHGFGKLPP